MSLIVSSTHQLDIQHFHSKISLRNDLVSLSNISRYSMKYRVLKTILLTFAWISFGLNNEIISSTYEDLRISLSLNYDGISTAMVNRGIGMLIMMFFSGYLYDKFSNYAELLMAVSGFFLVLPNFFIPYFKNYMLTYLCFLIQGFAMAVWDIGGNHIILSVWEGISTSPLNAMHAGYGIGGLLAVQLSKPFIKFGKKTEGANSTVLMPEDIDIQTPYSISASIGVFLVILFIIAQIIELKNTSKFNSLISSASESKKSMNKDAEEVKEPFLPKNQNFVKTLFFGDKVHKGAALAYLTIQIILITFLLFFLAGFITIINKFMLTYLTKGPANFSVNTYTQIQTMYWIVFVSIRFMTAILAFKLDATKFVFYLLFANVVSSFLFIYPYFTTFSEFYWVGIFLMGITSGPMQPSVFMAAKEFLVEYNSFIMSVFTIGIAVGAIAFQELGGKCLDYFNEVRYHFLGFEVFEPATIISHLFFGTSFMCFLLYIPIFVIYKQFVHVLKKK